MGTMSEAFGFNCNISLEVINCEYHDKYWNYVSNEENVNMDFHPHFPYDYAQDADNAYEHMKSSFTFCIEIICLKRMV